MLPLVWCAVPFYTKIVNLFSLFVYVAAYSFGDKTSNSKPDYPGVKSTAWL